MKTKLKRLSLAVLTAASLSLSAGTQAQSMSGMAGMMGMPGMSGMAGMAAMMGMPGMAGMSGMSGMSGMAGMAGMQGMSGMQGMALAMQAQAELMQRVQMSRMAIGDFVTSLKGELVAAMKAGGPVKAIGVCNEKAPVIAEAEKEKVGFDVGRVSLKNRNPDNAPDEWETLVLQLFETLKKLGNAPGSLEYYDVVDTGSGREFRYMKAIPTGEVCTKCHGTDLDPKVAAKLKELYPDDKATGFKVGDIRGAFTIRQKL